jgi:hypothetical protein
VRRLSATGRNAGRAILFILPVVVGGLGHVAVLKTNFLASLAVPIDCGARWRGRPVFGANKTWRGIVVMTGSTALAAAVQAALASWVGRANRSSGARQAVVSGLATGAVCGFTYCLAELPNSFVKRRLGISPGERAGRRGRLQYLVDQADSVAGCLVPLRLLYRANAGELLAAFVLGLTIHVAIDAARS